MNIADIRERWEKAIKGGAVCLVFSHIPVVRYRKTPAGKRRVIVCSRCGRVVG